jgi:hypothetical protein
MERKLELVKTLGLARMKFIGSLMNVEEFCIIRISTPFGMQELGTIIVLVNLGGNQKVSWVCPESMLRNGMGLSVSYAQTISGWLKRMRTPWCGQRMPFLAISL